MSSVLPLNAPSPISVTLSGRTISPLTPEPLRTVLPTIIRGFFSENGVFRSAAESIDVSLSGRVSSSRLVQSLNALSSIAVTVEGILTAVREVQPSNAFLGILVISSGRVTFSSDVQPEKVSPPLSWKQVQPITASLSAVQPSKVFHDIFSTVSGTVTELRAVQFLKALYDISFTLAGIVTEVISVLPLKALPFITSTPSGITISPFAPEP